MPRMEFGKYAGMDYSEVPASYFEWIIKSSEDKILDAKAELERRKIKVEDSFMARIVTLGYDELRKTDDPKKCELARDALMQAIKDAAQP